VVTALTPEPATARVQAWFEDHGGESLLVSDWVVSEVSSALAFKLRAGSLDLSLRAAALGAFARMIEDVLVVLPVGTPHFQAAAKFADRHELGLRAPDALHLAVCADHGATLVTLDRRLLAAAPHLGVAVEEP
jgi:predicted nucleic acid-binding protein